MIYFLKHLKQILLFLLVLFIILSCEKEKITDWDSIIPGHYVGDLQIRSVIDSTRTYWYKYDVIIPFWHYDTTFQTNSYITSTEDGWFEMVFEENEIMDLKAISFYILEDFDDRGTDVMFRKDAKFGNLGIGSFNIDNGVSFTVYYDYLFPWDSAFAVSFSGTKTHL